MVRISIAAQLLVVTSVALVGCGNAIVGDWDEVGSDCQTGGDFTVDDDLNVDGTMSVSDGITCARCNFSGDVTDRGDDRYSANIRFDNCDCAGDYTADADCRLNDDGDRLDCTLDFGVCGSLQGDWRKRD